MIKKVGCYHLARPRRKYRMLVLAFVFAVLLFFIKLIFAPPTMIISYAVDENASVGDQLTQTVFEQLDGLDLKSFQNVLQGMSERELALFGGTNFLERITGILKSETPSDYNSLFSQILGILFDELLAFLPLFASICGIAILSSFIGNLKTKSNEKSISDIIHFVCFGIIIVLIAGAVLSFVGMTKSLLTSIQLQMQIAFPILITLTAALGGVVSVGVYQPAVAILTNGIMEIFNFVVLPLFICSFIFSIVGNMSSGIKLDKFVSFFGSAFKWVTGTIFTLFLTFLTIQGITAASADGISIRTAKYAIKSYIPLVGGHLSDGFSLILSSSMLIKNAVGVVGLLLLFATIMIPVIKIVIFSLGLKLTSAIIEPISDSRISNFVYTVSKSMNYLVATILAVSFMYLICVGLIICTSNAFV